MFMRIASPQGERGSSEIGEYGLESLLVTTELLFTVKCEEGILLL